MGIHVNNSLQATTTKKGIFLQCPIPWPKIDNQNDQKYILSVYMLRIRQSVTEHITATTPQSTSTRVRKHALTVTLCCPMPYTHSSIAAAAAH